MKKKLVILILFALVALGGKMLPVETPSAPAFHLADSVPYDVPATSIKIDDGLSLVVRVIDGDTIVAEIDGVQEKIRLIGVDTPEVIDSRRTVECFGKEASEFTKNLLTDVRVRLESDPTQGDRDRYGRLLRYVFLSDGTLVNKAIIAEGYGHEYTYRRQYRYQDDFKSAERVARETEQGLWSPGACIIT